METSVSSNGTQPPARSKSTPYATSYSMKSLAPTTVPPSGTRPTMDLPLGSKLNKLKPTIAAPHYHGLPSNAAHQAHRPQQPPSPHQRQQRNHLPKPHQHKLLTYASPPRHPLDAQPQETFHLSQYLRTCPPTVGPPRLSAPAPALSSITELSDATCAERRHVDRAFGLDCTIRTRQGLGQGHRIQHPKCTDSVRGASCLGT